MLNGTLEATGLLLGVGDYVLFHDPEEGDLSISLVGVVVMISQAYLSVNVPKLSVEGGSTIYYNIPAEFVYLIYSNIPQAKQRPTTAT